jgi:hypothetical protein
LSRQAGTRHSTFLSTPPHSSLHFPIPSTPRQPTSSCPSSLDRLRTLSCVRTEGQNRRPRDSRLVLLSFCPSVRTACRSAIAHTPGTGQPMGTACSNRSTESRARLSRARQAVRRAAIRRFAHRTAIRVGPRKTPRQPIQQGGALPCVPARDSDRGLPRRGSQAPEPSRSPRLRLRPARVTRPRRAESQRPAPEV